MRVISGEYGGRRLKALSGDNTRPTTDKVKEALFNMIGPYFDGGRVLDLFSGSGGLAIEAISRGCEHAICVDKNFQALRTIKENIAITREPEKFTTLKMDAEKALVYLAKEQQQFELIFLDPPYAKQKIVAQIQQLDNLGLTNEHTRIICETERTVELPENINLFCMSRQQIYGITAITIYGKEENE